MRKVPLRRQRIEVEAPRDLLFEVVASAGKEVGKSERGMLVEFEIELRDRVIKTVEELQLDPPERIRYRWVEGPLDDVDEEIVFEATGSGSTVMIYSGRLGTAPGVIAWLRTRFLVRPAFDRAVHEHLMVGKQIAEKRAERSHVYSQGTDVTR